MASTLLPAARLSRAIGGCSADHCRINSRSLLTESTRVAGILVCSSPAASAAAAAARPRGASRPFSRHPRPKLRRPAIPSACPWPPPLVAAPRPPRERSRGGRCRCRVSVKVMLGGHQWGGQFAPAHVCLPVGTERHDQREGRGRQALRHDVLAGGARVAHSAEERHLKRGLLKGEQQRSAEEIHGRDCSRGIPFPPGCRACAGRTATPEGCVRGQTAALAAEGGGSG